MDFNLSSICDMLGDRIEEYKTTSKKRKIEIERGSCAPKAKVAKFTHENQTESSMKKHGSSMYASTPIDTPKTESQPFSSLTRFSSINKLPEARSQQLSRNLNLEAKTLSVDEDDCTEVTENSEMEDSQLSFPSATKTSLETLKRRRFQRKKVSVRRLFFDEDDQNSDQCLSQVSADNEDNMDDKCLYQDSANHEEYKSSECLSEDSTSDNLTKDSACKALTKARTPLYTPKRHRLPRKCINARRLNFDDAENEDNSLYYSFSNDCSSEKTLGQVKSPKNFKDQNLTESLPNDCFDSTLKLDNEEMDYSTIMVLNVGILIRPIRDTINC